MSPLFRNQHPTCVRCRGTKCAADVTCDICKDWSVAQWESFLKKRPYSGRRKSHPSGSALPSVPPNLPPFISASSEAGHSAPPPCPPTPPSEGRGYLGEWGSPPHEVSSPPFRRSVGGGGGTTRVSSSGAASDSAASSLPGVGVAGSSRV